jgi:predicted dienelactone hydrolase
MKGASTMRVFETLFLFSLVPILLLPFSLHRWQRGWRIVSTLLPMLVGGIHLIAEGWRIQMVPLYILAVLILAYRWPMLVGRADKMSRRRGILVSSAMALLLALCGVLAGWLLPVVTLPTPTGPYQVGIVDREIVDQVRGRRLMVSIWYPAAQSGASALLTNYPKEVADGLGKLSGVPGLAFQHLRYFRLAASEDVPLQVEDAPFPVLVFSHGLVGLRLQNSSTLQNLASWGYVVVALDHTDAAAVTVFPDGEARFYSLESFGIPSNVEPDKALVDERVFPVWVADQLFVYDIIETWAANDPMLAGKLDVARIGSFGHSFGGATALEVCLIDTRCRAAVNIDGGLYGRIVTQPAVRPLLLMSSAESNQYADAIEDWTRMVENANADAYWLELPGSTHFSFTITQLLSPILAPKDFDPRAGLHIVDTYLRTFFDVHLRGMETPPSEAGSGETDVRWLTEERFDPFQK